MTKVKAEVRKQWWKARFQTFRLWLWCVAGIGITVMLPGLKNGIVGITLYLPSPVEIGLALFLGLAAVVADDQLGGDKVDSPKVYRRKAKHAFIVGIGVLSLIERLLGG